MYVWECEAVCSQLIQESDNKLINVSEGDTYDDYNLEISGKKINVSYISLLQYTLFVFLVTYNILVFYCIVFEKGHHKMDE